MLALTIILFSPQNRPTRELASQIELEAEKLTHGISTIQPVVVYGGANAKAQLKELAIASGSGNDLIVVATPGRLTDFVDRNLVCLSDVKYLVLDEADRCLDMGFEPQIRKIVQQSGMTPKEKRQTFLFSATFPPAIQKLAAEFLREYVWIAVGRVGSTTDSIKQVVIQSTPDKRTKLELVVNALEKGPNGRTLIFVQKKKTATWLKKQLKKGGPDAGPKATQVMGRNKNIPELTFKPIMAEEIHGDRSQFQREAALEKFRSGECKVLVATDVAARGLDIPGKLKEMSRFVILVLKCPSDKRSIDFVVKNKGWSM
jgi:ATP-dependent RNA helicase DDX3X